MVMDWIPIEKDLPQKSGEYICTVDDRYTDKGIITRVCEYGNTIAPGVPEDMKDCVLPNGGAFGEEWSDGMDNLEKVLAWMPLPKPYKPNKGK